MHPNSAANRAYYAVHHALRSRLGDPLPDEHGLLWRREFLERVGLDVDGGERIQNLYHFRRVADYEPNDVDPSDAEECWQDAKYVVEDLLGFGAP